MTTPSKADVLRVAADCDIVHYADSLEWEARIERFAAAMYSAGTESAKSEGWRQCAVGQHTSQFCGQLEVEKAKAYAKGAEDMRERAKDMCHKRIHYFKTSQACYQVELDIAALPITPTNTEEA